MQLGNAFCLAGSLFLLPDLHFGLGLLDEPSLKMFKALEQQRHGGVKAGRFHLEPSLPAATDECRPCCPANVFLGSANGTPSPPPADAPACVLRLTGHGLRCLQRFHEKHGLKSMTFQSQEGCCLLNFCTVCMVWGLLCFDTHSLRFGFK